MIFVKFVDSKKTEAKPKNTVIRYKFTPYNYLYDYLIFSDCFIAGPCFYYGLLFVSGLALIEQF